MVVFVTSAPYLNEGHSYGFASNVGHTRSDSVGLLVFDGMRIVFGAPMLYNRPLKIVPTLLGRVNILYRPYGVEL
jgi:hypothetical protein